MALPYHSFISWDIGAITIQSYGLMVALAFLAGLFLAVKEAKKRKLDEEIIYDLAFYILIGGIVGARIANVIQEWGYYSGNLAGIFKIWQGGLNFNGGFILASLLAYIYLKRKRLNFWLYMDTFAPSIAIGHAIGRIGCILGDGGHVGKLTNMPWGFLVNGEARHVTAWYELFFLIALFILLTAIKDKKKIKGKTGSLFLIYLSAYSVGRSVIDIFRADPTYLGLTSMQWTAIPFFFISVYLLNKRYRFLNKFAIKGVKKWQLKK